MGQGTGGNCNLLSLSPVHAISSLLKQNDVLVPHEVQESICPACFPTENITAVHVIINKTVSVLELLQPNVSVLAGQTIYTGPLNVRVRDQKGVLLYSSIYPRNSSRRMVRVELSLSQPGNTTVTFQAANNISSASMTVELLVVGECVIWLSK